MTAVGDCLRLRFMRSKKLIYFTLLLYSTSVFLTERDNSCELRIVTGFLRRVMICCHNFSVVNVAL